MALGLFWPLPDIGWGILCSDLFIKTKKATQRAAFLGKTISKS